MKIAIFGAGCFWGVEENFRTTEGVLNTSVGYQGGSKENPTYEEVCSKTTGHAEVVQVQFDPSLISYDELLERFFSIHNPTTLNQQGPDIGSQYRSIIFFQDELQKEKAYQKIDELNKQGVFQSPIVTQIEEATTFYKAEEYHQQYFHKKGGGTCGLN
jgi:peptide-methionine (S)-S-oxide reductase